MNYIGSKLSLLEFLDESISKVIDKNCHVFCDLFAGTGIVGSYFKKKGYTVIANDIQYYSFVLNKQYIENHEHLNFQQLIKILPKLKNIEIAERKNFICDYLSNLKGIKGFIFKNYCLGGTQNKEFQRQYFSDENGKRCDAIRTEIEKWKKEKLITNNEYYFLLATLIETIDKRANTASVYGAFLKQLKKTAQTPLVLKPAELIINDQKHQVFNEDINELASKVAGDILYLDPPYNHRQYATNYHLLETVAKYDNPKIHGKTGLREYEKQKSLYCSRTKVKKAFTNLILKAKVKYIFLSYNNEGLMSLDDIKEIMSLRGKYGHFTKEYNRFKADTSENRNYKAKKTVEYLHYVVVK
ncbi:MAG: modification methylase [Candidatus Jacksonbacteria bacterium RIFOXYC2_FULL_44_29]|nr:MAG: Site-specific DNA-methyltransferase (Adenine-specific) [Parcubacteria group bacterium GW2011_GWA2_42_28]KKT56250.1 MAG: Site-specific DNA-methyltransferase (Adenine-specific) [Parcubacteria group bacterium GW2011_GWC2_44_22]OGY76102.1 MAG: modification methylase [Candidatus Jacksonbacteria bacterium RIFOXYA2_FULL_43_12]OGY77693.1 MAG: modification methylase [Candidatus Jacksonbacteria bacterium RIFOXYB2_FULL_44_15]OGY78829.1 MAG: modification methylase [Candidatus Jacksonbacteria bacter